MSENDNNNTQEQISNDELLLKSGFSKEQLLAMKDQANQKIEADKQAQYLEVQHTSFKEVYDRLINDPSMAPMKDVLETELGSNPKYKDMGGAGVEVLIGMAKKEVELLKYKGSTESSTAKVDNLAGTSNGTGGKQESGDSAMLADNPNLIDFNKVTLEGVSQAQKDFILIQRERQNRI